MKTVKQVIKDNKQFELLINAVIEQLGGTDYIQDIQNHGMEAGFPGFTYYKDTHEFAIKNQSEIVAMLEDSADQFGQEVSEMVSNFGVFRNAPMDKDDRKDLYKYLSGVAPEQGAITNVMAWFAAEEVARMFES